MELKGVHNSFFFKHNRVKKLENAAVQTKKLGTGASSNIPCEPKKRGRKGSAPYLQHARVSPSCNPMARSLGELQLVAFCGWKKAGRIITSTHQGLVWNTHRFLLLALPRFLFLRLRPAKEQNTCMHPGSCRRFWRTTAARHVFGPPGLPYCTKPW